MTGLADFYTATSDENKASHIEIFKKELEVCDKMIAQYLLIIMWCYLGRNSTI